MSISPTTVRANGSSLRGYLAVFTGSLVLTADVAENAGVLSAKSLSISITAGNISDVQRGYRVIFEDGSGNFKGESHVRWGGTLDSTHLPVREFSQSQYLILAGDVVKVYSLIALTDKLVEASDTFDPDGVPVGTYNSAPPPLACSGGLDAGFVDGYETGTVLTYRTVTTDGSHSLILDPTSNLTHITHLWTRPAGVALAPGSLDTDVSPTFRVNVGEHTVYHDVTDTDNGQTWRQCINYQVFDAAHLPIGVIMETAPTGDADQGWSCTFRSVNFLDLAAYPDGSLVAFFVREQINGTWQSLGGATGRSAIKLVGLMSHDESDLTPQLQFQRFEVISPLQRLGQLPGFSKILLQSNTPDDWTKIQSLTILRAQIQLMRMYTFALDGVFDLLVSTLYNNYDYAEVWLQKDTPLSQVRELADGMDGRLTCTRSGQFRLDPNPPLIPPASRAGLTTVYTYSRRDIARMLIRRDHFDTVETLELHATRAAATGNLDDNTPFFSRAPGSPGLGSNFITVERIICANAGSQTDTNARAGRRYALNNGVYVSSTDGQTARAPEIEVELRQVYDFLDFDDQIVMFSSFPNPRDIDLTFFQWTLTKVRLDYTNGKVMHTFRPLTDAPAGADYFPPTDTVVIPPPPPQIYPPTNPPLIPPYSGALPTAGFCLSYGEGAAALITALDSGALIFDPWTTGITGAMFFDGCSNPYNYRQSFGLSDAGLEMCSDVPNKGAWSLTQSNAAMFGSGKIGHRIRATIHRNGCLLSVSGSNVCARTDDLYNTVTQVSINGLPLDPSATDFANGLCDIGWVEATPGAALALAPWSGDGDSLAVYHTGDYGRTWTLITASLGWAYSNCRRFWIEVPYTRSDGTTPNADDANLEAIVYIAGDVHTGVTNKIILYTSRFAAGSQPTPAMTSYQASSPAGMNHPASAFTHNSTYVYFLDGGELRLSSDHLATYSAPLATIGNARYCSVNGWSPNPLPVIGYTKQAASQGVSVSVDGVTFANGYPTGWAGGIAYAEFSLYTVIA